MEKNDSKKSIQEQLKEEQDNLLTEINEKAKKRKALMNPNDKYDTDNELLK